MSRYVPLPGLTLCGVTDVMEVVFGRLVGMVMVFAGFVGWMFTSFRHQGLLLLGIGGLAMSVVPSILAASMGVACGP